MQVATPRRAKSHFAAHGQSHFATLEPLDNAAADGDAGHFDAASENHKAYSGEFGRGRHAFVEGRDAQFVKARDVVQVVVEPHFQATAGKHVGDGIPVDGCADQHHRTRKYGREAHAHLVEDNAGKYKEEYEYVEECFAALHCAESGGIPSAFGLHQVFDRRQDVHEDVRAEHCQCQQSEGCPPCPRFVAEAFGPLQCGRL